MKELSKPKTVDKDTQDALIIMEELDTSCNDLIIDKRSEYGTWNINVPGPLGVVIRMMDKVSRLHNLLSQGKEPKFESIEDTIRDIRNYNHILNVMLKRGYW